MNGMLTHRFSGWSSEDLAISHSFHHEFAPAAALCEFSLTPASENDDQAGTNLGSSPTHTPTPTERRTKYLSTTAPESPSSHTTA